MKTENQSFENVLRQFEHKTDLRSAFDDFLTMSICAFGQNPNTGKSYDEELYLQTIAKYKDDPIRFEFPTLLACLTKEMTERMDSVEGWDVLGDYYEQNLSRGRLGQYFTPWPICQLMAQSTMAELSGQTERSKPLRILDPSCGSGRMLMAASRVSGPLEHYYGIDIDHTCAKMASLNLFLSGLFRMEVMCGNALLSHDFNGSYKTRYIPFGLFRIQEKEHSELWHLTNSVFQKKEKEIVEPPELPHTKQNNGSQLIMF